MDLEVLIEKFCSYADFIRGRSQPTLQGYKVSLKQYMDFTKVTQLEHVTPENIRRFFIDGRVRKSWQPATFYYYHKNLAVFFRWCQKNGYIAANPTEGIETPKIPKRLPKNLTKDEANRILEIAYNYPYKRKASFQKTRNHAILATFLFAGLRKKELLNLKRADVDVDNFTIFVRQGKGAKDRIVPMSYTLAQSLKRYLRERNSLKKTCPEFFASLNLNMGFTDIGVRRLIIKIAAVTNKKFTIHQLRHTFATLMLEGGCDIYSLSRMMGHSDIKTTTIYLSASAEHLRSEITKHPLNDLKL